MVKENKRKQVNQRRTGDRRMSEERRADGERRLVDMGSPDRRLGDERRRVDVGPPERRDSEDRRETESGPPPGWKDRRRWAERRIPAVAEVPFEIWEKERSDRAVAAAGEPLPEHGKRHGD
ncbi:MAG TPA: hypothetical protein VFY24_16520 [Azospira sp.]|nr:hypothetical protein [Azospira sp.]